MASKFTKGIFKTPKWQLSENQVTSESTFSQRRKIIKSLGIGSLAASLSSNAHAGLFDALFNHFSDSEKKQFETEELQHKKLEQYSQMSQKLTPYNKVTQHNNFYEFGTSKIDPYENSQNFKVNPWQLQVSGEVNNPLNLDYDDLYKYALEERIYRLRCVEAWSMVVPWLGFPLASILQKADVKSSGRYISFETLYDPKQMPGQKNSILGGGIDYPYIEGLTIEEAMNDLSFLAVGLYGKTLSPQNGAPIRLVVPWKYGFKSIKSIVAIRVTNTQPNTSWNLLAPQEYGFFANVNPNVDHPRWSQASERRLGDGGLLSATRIPTLMFNGYQEQVSHLYQGMDLRTFY